FNLISDIGQALFLGAAEPFSGANFQLTQKGVGYGLQFAYFNGKDLSTNDGWVTLGPDQLLDDRTSNWTLSGLIRFVTPVDWTETAVNKLNLYWLRVTTTTKPGQKAQVSNLTRDLTGKVAQFLETRRLLTTRIHVVKPRFVKVGVRVTVQLESDAK